MGFLDAIGRLLESPERGEQRITGRRERFRQARHAAAERLEQDACRNIEDAVEGPAGDELREQGYKMFRQAEALRSGETSLLSALGFGTDEEETNGGR